MRDVRVIHGDCLDVLPSLAEGGADAIVTDPPYGLEFMGKEWDRGVPGVPFWEAALRVLKPGGYMLAMGGTRTYHRLACAVEDAGWEIRDCLMWMYGTGFPKGRGCLKPAYEPILLARKPGRKVLPLGIDECRIGTEPVRSSGDLSGMNGQRFRHGTRPRNYSDGVTPEPSEHSGRYPANVAHDGTDEVLEAFAAFGESKGGGLGVHGHRASETCYRFNRHEKATVGHGDAPGTAARFFYTAKASRAERGEDNTHPTVKPLALMRWLVRLVCPAGGLVLDPFAGSGTTLLAAQMEGRRAVGIEQDAEHIDTINRRLRDHEPLFQEVG